MTENDGPTVDTWPPGAEMPDDEPEPCTHPADERGRIMSTDGPVDICTRCMGRVTP